MRVSLALISVLSLLLVQQSHAATGTAPARHEPVTGSHVCPATDFSEFLKAFADSEVIQRAFTKFPLKKQQLDSIGGAEPKRVIKTLNRQEVRFPLVPLQAARKTDGLNLRIEEVSPRIATAMLYKIDSDYQVSYEFVRNGCWVLIAINDQSISAEEKVVHNWLDMLFPSATKCTPNNFYYDKNTKRTNNGILEKLGYSPYKVDDHTAKYKIHEKFYGMDAIEIAIPSGTDSMYVITVSNGAKDLFEAILKKSGERLDIYRNGFKARSGVAYLISVNEKESSFVCFTYEG